MRSLLGAVMAATVACGPNSTSDHAVDAKSGGTGSATGGTDLAVNCQDFVFTDVRANGTKTVQKYSHALVAAGPDDDVTIYYCVSAAADPYVSRCPPGDTCTGSVYPPGKHCSKYLGGLYADGKLTVQCGYTIIDYDAQGGVTSSTQVLYEDIRAHKN